MTSFDPTDTCALNYESSELETFGIFVAAHQNRIFGFILKNVSCIATAEGLTPEAFLAAYRNLSRFRGDAKLSTWVTGIALILVRNHLNRSDMRRQETVTDEWLLNRIDGGGDPLQDYEKKEFLHGLHEAMAALPSDLREAVILVAMEGFSYIETVEILGIAEGTVEAVCFGRGRDKFSELLAGRRY